MGETPSEFAAELEVCLKYYKPNSDNIFNDLLTLSTNRAYFRKIRHPFIESLIEKSPFWKKRFSQFELRVSKTTW